jgi:hypothetical protein
MIFIPPTYSTYILSPLDFFWGTNIGKRGNKNLLCPPPPPPFYSLFLILMARWSLKAKLTWDILSPGLDGIYFAFLDMSFRRNNTCIFPPGPIFFLLVKNLLGKRKMVYLHNGIFSPISIFFP